MNIGVRLYEKFYIKVFIDFWIFIRRLILAMSLDVKKPIDISFREIVERELSRFPKRTQDIVKSRFGIDEKNNPMTLESIGSRYGITRERIRQIVQQVLRDFGSQSEVEVRVAIETLESLLQSRGGISLKEEVYSAVSDGDASERGAVDLFLDYSDRFSLLDRDPRFHPSVGLSNFDTDSYDQILSIIRAIFEKEGRPFVFEEMYDALRSIRPDTLEKEHFASYLKSSSQLAVNPFGHWGLVHWPEVNPKSTRDKAYLVLKYEKAPLHFREIASRIDSHGLGRKKMTNPQTVHNELIKDTVFSLVGRGVYGLREWGHNGGTIRDVIEKVLHSAGRPMNRREICEAVSKEEKSIKATTILINLNMHFVKVGKDLYALPNKK